MKKKTKRAEKASPKRSRSDYKRTLYDLQVQLVKLQSWLLESTATRACIVVGRCRPRRSTTAAHWRTPDKHGNSASSAWSLDPCIACAEDDC